MTNNITTIGEPVKPIITCLYCNIDTGGNHAWNCPVNTSYIQQMESKIIPDIRIKLTQTNHETEI